MISAANNDKARTLACKSVVELGYTQEIAQAALEATNWRSPEAAINWILENPGATKMEFTRLQRQVSDDAAAAAAAATAAPVGHDSGSVWLEPGNPRSRWVCSDCTLHNEHSNRRCEVCQQGTRPDPQ